eukprot:281054_1
MAVFYETKKSEINLKGFSTQRTATPIHIGTIKKAKEHTINIIVTNTKQIVEFTWRDKRKEKRHPAGYHFRHEKWKKSVWMKQNQYGRIKNNPKISVVNVKIQSRYSVAFGKSIVGTEEFIANDRNHNSINLSLINLKDEGDKALINILVDIMDESIKKDVQKSIDTQTLVHRNSEHIKKLWNNNAKYQWKM